MQVCIQRLTLNCEIDEFEERNHQAGAYALVRRFSHASPGSMGGKCWILDVGLRTARSGSWLLDG